MAMDRHVTATEIYNVVTRTTDGHGQPCYGHRGTISTRNKKKKTPHFIIHTQLLITLFYTQWGMLQRMKLQRTNATTNSFYNKKIRMLQQTQMLQRTRRNTKGRRSTCMHLMCWASPL